MELGPNQTRFIEALEGDLYNQGSQVLHNLDKNCFCVLGVGAHLFAEGFDVVPDIRARNAVVYNHATSVAPAYLIEALGLYSDVGSTKYSTNSLVSMNDGERLSFPEIAARLRESPETFFKEPR